MVCAECSRGKLEIVRLELRVEMRVREWPIG